MSIWVVLKDLLIFFRDRKSFITLLLMPLILIAILGAAFGNLMGDDENVNIQRFTLGYVDQDNSDYSNLLIEEVFEKSLKDYVELEKMTKEELETGIKEETVLAGIVIPDHFSSSLEDGKETNVDIITGHDADLQLIVIESGMNQFSQIVQSRVAIGEVVGELQAEAQEAIAQQQGEFADVVEVEMPEFESVEVNNLIAEQSVRNEAPPISSFQYYAAGMGVMFLLMTVVFSVGYMIEERENEVYHRLLVSSLKNRQYLLGKFIGLILVCVIQFSIIIIGTNLLFQIDWGSSISAIMLTVFSFTVSASGLGVFIGSFIKSESIFSNIGIIGTQILAAIGGSMVPLYLFPVWMLSISKIIPNALALQMFLDIMAGSGVRDIGAEALFSIGIGLVLFLIAWIRLSWKGGKKKYA